MALTLRLILGDQLNSKHSWFSAVDDNITYLMMEIRQETDYVTHHIQKVTAFFASMRNFANWLEKRGHQVLYLTLDDDDNSQDLIENIRHILKKKKHQHFEYLLPDEYRLDEQLQKFCSALELQTNSIDSEHFLTTRDDLASFFGDKKYLMETFYRDIRKKNGWLMNGEKPEGGRWNYDKENRKSLPDEKVVIEPLVFNHDVTAIVEMLKTSGVKTLGEINAKHFPWPLDRAESLKLLRFFFNKCFRDYGRYQDAMHTDHWSMFHSRISFSLNTKMLSPREVVDEAIEYYRKNDEISLAAVEGFLRQIVGWREFMRGVYWAKMPEYAQLNVLGNERRLPKFYWTGKTKMNCLRHAINQSLEKAYAHHIQRLMVTGNFALLAGVHPDQVDEWYLGIYIDAIEWVEMTNTRGMSQFADGGVFATKPYVSSANYINKMSNYCGPCHYNHKERVKNTPCPFNSLYWYFLDQHSEKLANNHRMRMMYSRLKAMTPSERKEIGEQAEKYLEEIDDL
jgi:deoxyribodipyrimidine photolyase-related protein